jgi:hypothetical protein
MLEGHSSVALYDGTGDHLQAVACIQAEEEVTLLCSTMDFVLLGVKQDSAFK